MDKETIEQLGHEICLGIRKALFGANCSDQEDIGNGLFAIAEAIEELAEAIKENKTPPQSRE